MASHNEIVTSVNWVKCVIFHYASLFSVNWLLTTAHYETLLIK